MATKSRKTTSKKSAKKSGKKMARKTAQVQLDAEVVNRFESHLREGLVASGAVLMSTVAPTLRAGAKVEIDSDTIARLAEILRDGLVASGAVLAAEYPEQAQTTRKASTKSKRKRSATAKKR